LGRASGDAGRPVTLTANTWSMDYGAQRCRGEAERLGSVWSWEVLNPVKRRPTANACLSALLPSLFRLLEGRLLGQTAQIPCLACFEPNLPRYYCIAATVYTDSHGRSTFPVVALNLLHRLRPARSPALPNMRPCGSTFIIALLSLATRTGRADPTWPAATDEMEEIVFQLQGFKGRLFNDLINPCKNEAAGPGRITAAEWLRVAFQCVLFSVRSERCRSRVLQRVRLGGRYGSEIQ